MDPDGEEAPRSQTFAAASQSTSNTSILVTQAQLTRIRRFEDNGIPGD
jgi:hypothetical protein